jgi:hypothetical protein
VKLKPIQRIFPLAALATLALAASSQAAILISDNFDSVAAAAGLNNRTPTFVDPLAGTPVWQASSANFLGNGAGGLTASYGSTVSVSAGLNLGAGFFSTNKGVYEISTTITHPTSASASASWIGLGFATGLNTSVNLTQAGTAGQPWMIYRLNGNTVVFSGAGAAGDLTSGGANTATTGAILGDSNVFTLRLDTSGAAWTVDAFADGFQLDLNGATAGRTFTYTVNPTISHVVLSSGVNVDTTATSTVDNFSLSFVAVPEPTSALLLVAGAGMFGLRRRR